MPEHRFLNIHEKLVLNDENTTTHFYEKLFEIKRRPLTVKEELLKGLTEEQIAKVKACKNHAELLALAEKEDIKLTEEQLDAINGGICTSTPDFTCPKCGSKKIKTKYNENSIAEWWNNTCQDCGYVWIVNK